MATKTELKDKAKRLRKLASDAEKAAGGSYDSHRAKMAEKSRERAKLGQEIGPLPPVKDHERKARCKDSTRDFLPTYFPRRFPLPHRQRPP